MLTSQKGMEPNGWSSDGSDSTPSFTPDGKGLAYVIHVDGADNLWVQPIDGRKGYKLTEFKSDEISDFAWSPNGHRLAIVSAQNRMSC